MRRMLDPKEVGGGGGSTAKLYKHNVSLFSSSYGKVEITIYNYNDVVIDSETKLENAMKSIGRVIATGYIQNGSVYHVYSVFFNYSDETVYAVGYYTDTSSGKTNTTSMALDYHFSSFKDDVKEVS